jgi:hypothetical protein
MTLALAVKFTRQIHIGLDESHVFGTSFSISRWIRRSQRPTASRSRRFASLILQKILGDVFVGKAHVTAKFVDGNGLIAFLAMAGADNFHDAAGRTVALTGNTADIFCVYDVSFQRHNRYRLFFSTIFLLWPATVFTFLIKMFPDHIL